MEYYTEKSKLYLLVFLLPLLFYIFYKNDHSLSIYFCFIFLLYISLFSSKKYLIRDQTLKIPSKYIDIQSIIKIERRRFNIKSAYFYFDKIVLVLNDGEEFKISPKNEQEFIKQLLLVNPNIELKIKTNIV